MQRGSRTDEIFTLIFMAFAVIAAVCALFVSNRVYFLVFGGIAVVVRIVQYILRFFK